MLTGRMLFLANGDTKEEDGLVWKTAARTGRWEISPGVNGPHAKPLVFVPGRSSDLNSAIGLQDIVDSFEDGAVEHVTVPKSHADLVDENTGYVEKLKVEPQPDGSQHLMAGIRFTEPDIKEKVTRGSIANSSMGLKFNHQRKEDGKLFPIALDHFALTNKPWLSKLTPFGLSEGEEADVVSMNFSDESTEISTEAETPVAEQRLHIGDIVLTAKQYEAAKKYFSEQNSSSSSEATLGDQGNNPNPKDEPVKTADQIAAEKAAAEKAAAEAAPTTTSLSEDQVKTLLKPVSDQNAILLAEITALRKKDRERAVADSIAGLRKMGLSEDAGFTAFLKEAENIMLSDEGQKVLTLSEEGGSTVELSAGEIVQRLVSKFPTDEATGKLKLTLSQQTTDPLQQSAGLKPPATDPNQPTSPQSAVANLSQEELDKHVEELHERLLKAGSGSVAL